MAFIIAVVNKDNVPQLDVEAFCAATELRMNNNVAPHWPQFRGARLRAVPAGSEADSYEIPLSLVPSATVPNTLGVHGVAGGIPYGTVELDMCAKYGVPWTCAAWHEAVEIIGNPYQAIVVTTPDGRRWPRELVDFVTALEITLDGVVLGGCVTPEFFEISQPSGAIFDIDVTVAGTLAEKGIPPSGWSGWQNVDGSYSSAYGMAVPPSLRDYIGARRGRAWRWAQTAPQGTLPERP